MSVYIPSAKEMIFDFFEGDGQKRAGLVEILSTLCPDEEYVSDMHNALQNMVLVGEAAEYPSAHHRGLPVYGLPQRISDFD